MLKSHAIPPSPDEDSWVSNFSALIPHLFQQVQKALLSCAAPQNLPAVLLSEFSFFCSSILISFLQTSSGELKNKVLWYVASTTDNLAHSNSTENTCRIGLWIAAQPDVCNIRFNFPFDALSFMKSASNKFLLYSGTKLS